MARILSVSFVIGFLFVAMPLPAPEHPCTEVTNSYHSGAMFGVLEGWDMRGCNCLTDGSPGWGEYWYHSDYDCNTSTGSSHCYHWENTGQMYEWVEIDCYS